MTTKATRQIVIVRMSIRFINTASVGSMRESSLTALVPVGDAGGAALAGPDPVAAAGTGARPQSRRGR
ncbi:MAG: hypothetical protein BroJett022_01330 [Actinomycetes bacterium]|nr:MAG: hypothetical protein BroJett022_01330 [Actinomycetes bacterium]